MKEWGVDITNTERGGLIASDMEPSHISFTCCSVKPLHMVRGKTTGWVHRAVLKMKHVEMIGGVSYDKIDDQGLHITVTKGETSEPRVLDVDHIVVCAGQVSVNGIYEALKEETAFRTHLVGGAEFAGELDAKRAIRLASELAAGL